MEERKYKIMGKREVSSLEKAIIYKMLGPHLEAGTTDKAPEIQCLSGIKTH